MSGIGIINTAGYLSSSIQTNSEVCCNIQGLTPEWIINKTGIRKRHHITGDENASFLASMVAKKLLLENGFPRYSHLDVGLIIVATYSHDYYFPPLSAYIHSNIGASKDCQIIDINTNCTGLVTGTTMAVERMMANPKINFAIVIGVEILSTYVNKGDKFTAPFFSDGASGVLLGRVGEKHGYINSSFYTDSSVYEDVRLKRSGYIEHNGKATWTQAVTNIPIVVKKLAKESDININDIDFFIFHQANKVLIDYFMDKLRIPHTKTHTNVQEIGNTGAASIGLALDEAMKRSLIKKNDLLVLAGVGAGFNFGANLWRMQ